MNKILQLKDDLTMKDYLALENKIKSGQANGFDTRVLITAKNCRSNGSFEQEIKANKTALSGRTKLLEDNFPINPNMEQHIFINDNVLGETDPNTGVSIPGAQKFANSPLSILPRNNPELFKKRRVMYWCAGDGAMNKTLLNQSYPPHSTDTRLFHMIPFLVVPERGEANVDRSIYKGRVVFNQNHPLGSMGEPMVGYFFKKIEFDEVNGIKMVVDKQDYIPSWADTDTDLNAERIGYENKFKGDKIQSSYIDMSMHIASNEFKEYFTLMDSTLGNATISEIGLITGLEATTALDQSGRLTPMEDVDPNLANYNTIKQNSEVYDAELFAHLTFDPYPVSRDNATIDFDYRVYA